MGNSNSMDKVIEGLYIGGLQGITSNKMSVERNGRKRTGANSKEMLKERNITHILSIHITAEPQYPDDFQYKCIRIRDIPSSDLTPYFADCVDFIHEARMKGGGVYIHCELGKSRAVTITVMYLMTISSLDFRDSLRVVKHCRKLANPNSGFRQQLIKYGEEKVSEEKKRIKDKFPNTEKLDDENTLQNLLQEAR